MPPSNKARRYDDIISRTCCDSSPSESGCEAVQSADRGTASHRLWPKARSLHEHGFEHIHLVEDRHCGSAVLRWRSGGSDLRDNAAESSRLHPTAARYDLRTYLVSGSSGRHRIGMLGVACALGAGCDPNNSQCHRDFAKHVRAHRNSRRRRVRSVKTSKEWRCSPRWKTKQSKCPCSICRFGLALLTRDAV